MNDYRKFLKVIGMAVLIVSMMGGSVLAAERVAVRAAGEQGGHGVGIYVPNSYELPVKVVGLPNSGSETWSMGGQNMTIPIMYTPDLLLGFKIDMGGSMTIEPIAGLYYISGSDGGKGTAIGFAGGAKFFHTIARGSIGQAYIGGTGLIGYANQTVTVGSVDYFNTGFGLNVLGDMGVELFPFESLKKIGFTFDIGLPLLGYIATEAGAKSGGQTQSQKLSKINFLERNVVYTIGVHVYF